MKLELFLKKLRNAALAGVTASMALALSGCENKPQGDGAPPPAHVVEVPDMNLITIDNSDVNKFPLATAEKVQSAGQLSATGAVLPDVSREVPVISMANGRVVDIKARLDDNVKKGQLLLRVQSPDITSAFATYVKAANDEQLASKCLGASAGSFSAWRHIASHAGTGGRRRERRESRLDCGAGSVARPSA